MARFDFYLGPSRRDICWMFKPIFGGELNIPAGGIFWKLLQTVLRSMALRLPLTRHAFDGGLIRPSPDFRELCIDQVKTCSCYNGERGNESDDGRQHQTLDDEAQNSARHRDHPRQDNTGRSQPLFDLTPSEIEGVTVSIAKLYAWFGVPCRTVYYKPTKVAPSFGYRPVAWLLGFNKNTVQRIF